MAEWFAHKRFGCGSGRPISWQGWVVMLVYLALVIAAAYFLEHSPLAMASVIAPATVLFLVVSFRTTAGGWGCRWGQDK